MTRRNLFDRSGPPALSRDERGASAVEFALLAPVLALALLTTVDIGLAINQRMQIDHSLRAGAEGAFRDLGEDEVNQLTEDAAAEEFVIGSDGGDDQIEVSNAPLDVTTDRFCACPESLGSVVDCAAGSCAGSAAPSLFYRISAEKDYDAMLLPTFSLEGSLLVEVE